ncbi:MAG TPA: amidohydrolase family protein [Chloroflexota bacterium]
MNYTCISADNHLDLLWMPRDTWQRGLPARLRDAGPKVVETDQGSFWEWEGNLHGPAADGSDNGRLLDDILRSQGFEVPDGSLPPSDPEILLGLMDQQEMLAAITFGGLAWKSAKDPELLKAIYSVYNEFAFEVMAAAPERLVILPNVTARFPEECPAQIEALAKRGAKAVEFPYWDAGQPLYEDVWERTWAVAEALGIRLCGHLGNTGGTAAIPQRRNGARSAWGAAVPMTVAVHIGYLIFAGVFDRHPDLRFCFAETRIGWAPFWLSWADRQVNIRREDDPRFRNVEQPGAAVKLGALPSEIFRRNVSLTFETDAVGVQLLESTPALAHAALWGGDFPHPQGIWGTNTASQLDTMFTGVDPAIKERVLFDHSAELFGISVPPAV